MTQVHLVIPDTQTKQGVPNQHLTWIGKYIVDYQPDTIIHLGDHWDMSALSTYSPALEKEGQRLILDIEAGNKGFELLDAPLIRYNKSRVKRKKKQYAPRREFLHGNHEHRITRYVDNHPELAGFLDITQLRCDGWNVNDFLEVVKIDGVWYSHFFYNPKSGKPWGGRCDNILTKVGNTFTMGHRQGKDVSERTIGDGTTQRGLIAGSCYLHEEKYLGPQGAESWHGIIIKHEVENGEYDLMEVSLNYLCRKYEQMPLDKFLKEIK